MYLHFLLFGSWTLDWNCKELEITKSTCVKRLTALRLLRPRDDRRALHVVDPPPATKEKKKKKKEGRKKRGKRNRMRERNANATYETFLTYFSAEPGANDRDRDPDPSIEPIHPVRPTGRRNHVVHGCHEVAANGSLQLVSRVAIIINSSIRDIAVHTLR